MSFLCIMSIMFISLLYSLQIFCTKNIEERKDYGEFNLVVTDFTICKGPKRVDCNRFTAKVENGTNLIVDLDVNQDIIPNRGKIVAMMNDKPFIRLQMKKPCDHLFMKPLFQTILKIGPDCLLKKGKYHLNVDIEDVASKYYGGMFIYGNLSFKSVFYNDYCNLSCGVIEVNFSPKNNKTIT